MDGYEPPTYKTCDEVTPACPVDATVYGDYFTRSACIFFTAAHILLLIVQIVFGWRSKAWSFTIYLAIGTLFEAIGYGARVILSSNPWKTNAFTIQLLMLILGPTMIAAAISVTFKHLVLWFDPRWCVIRPKLYPWVFVGTDLISIVIQVAGGGVSALATSSSDSATLMDVGSALLVAGVVFQVVNMAFCGMLMLIYLRRRRRAFKLGNFPITSADESNGILPPLRGIDHRKDGKVKVFVWAITGAFVAIIIRCVYRVPEMSMGWGSELMQNETAFLLLDGAMVLIAVLLLTTFHPCFFFPFLGKKHEAKPEEHHMLPVEN